MDKNIQSWATTLLLAADAHQSRATGTHAFSDVLTADEAEIREQVEAFKDDIELFNAICSAYSSNPELATEFAYRNEMQWRFPLKVLTELTSQHASEAGVPWKVATRAAKCVEVVLEGIRAVSTEVVQALESTGLGKGTWKVKLFGEYWRVPGRWDRRQEVADLFTRDGEEAIKSLRYISPRVERAYVASETAFNTIVELEALVRKWTSWSIYLNVQRAISKLILGLLHERTRFAALLETERADCLIDGIVQVSFANQSNLASQEDATVTIHAWEALAIMLECADDLDDLWRTRRAQPMINKLKLVLRGQGQCPGRALFERLLWATKYCKKAVQPLLVICSHACEDYGIHNRFSKLQLIQLLPRCEDPECTDCGEDNELNARFVQKNLDRIRCENPACGKPLTRFPRCTKCLHAFYCGKDCQKEHFPEHKTECSSLKKCTQCHQIK